MFIAQKYRESNIVEYVLYMWHIEELIRSLNFDMALIEQQVVHAFNLNEEAKQQVRDWYIGLIHQMKQQGIQEKGHLAELNELVVELTYLHQSLLTLYQDKKYQQLVGTAQANLEELKKKSMGQQQNDIETAMNGLFGVLILKLKQREVSEATQEAMKTVSAMMAHLAKQYHNMKEGKLNLPKVMGN
jgi:hypothetical protein